MIKILARWWARRSYIWRLEKKAGEEELNAKLSALHAEQKRKQAAQFTAEADAIEKSVKEFAEKEERGFWRCQNGHEWDEMPNVRPAVDHDANLCVVMVNSKECGGEVRIVKRSEMTGQEKYESDKERKDAEQMVNHHGERVSVLEKDAAQLDEAVKHFQKEAARSHSVAKEVRSV